MAKKKKESKFEDFAEELGKLLGNAQAKAEGWLGQRTQIAKSLEGIRDTASKLLTDLGHQAKRIARKGQLAVGRIPNRSHRCADQNCKHSHR